MRSVNHSRGSFGYLPRSGDPPDAVISHLSPVTSDTGCSTDGRAGAADSSLPESRMVLLVPDLSMDLENLGACLRACSFSPIVLPRPEQLACLLPRWRPLVAVVGGAADGLHSLLRDFETEAIPVVFVGDADQIRLAASVAKIEIGILTPSDAREITGAVRAVTGKSNVTDTGAIRVNSMERRAWIYHEPVHLPPREFALLAELTRNSNEPIPSAELARRAWPDDVYATPEDVRRAIYRLRSLIGDRKRHPPLIQNRRGFGYVAQATSPRR